MAHNPEDSAGGQLAMIVGLKLLLSAYKGNPAAVDAMTDELERTRSSLLASSSSDRKLHAFNETADGLLDVLRAE
jgi:hypothetical protein